MKYIEDYCRKHLQQLDPFIEMKQRTFHSSHNAIDVLLSQLNVDVDPTIDLIENKSTIEQQFFNYMQVSDLQLISIIDRILSLDRSLG